MIHSLAGGKLQNIETFSLAKVEINNAFYWYKFNVVSLQVNNEVMVPFGKDNKLVKGKVISINKNVYSQVSPVPTKKLKQISYVINNK